MHEYERSETSAQRHEQLPDVRQHVILRKLAEDGRVVANELATLFRTSEDTIRRDLRQLAAAGHCRRVYGGALSLSPASAPILERMAERSEQKDALAIAMSGLVRETVRMGGVVILDAGSTNQAIARALPPDRRLTVVTNAPAVAGALLNRQGFEIVLIGGTLDPHVGGTLGANALRDVARVRADLAIIGACALSAEVGLGAFHYEDAAFKRAIAAGAAAVATAVTTDKLGCAAPFAVIDAEAVTHAVVEGDAPATVLASLKVSGVQIHVAGR